MLQGSCRLSLDIELRIVRQDIGDNDIHIFQYRMVGLRAVGMNGQIAAVHAKFTLDFFDNRPQRTFAPIGKRIRSEIQQTVGQPGTNRENAISALPCIRKIGKRPFKVNFRLTDFPAFQGTAQPFFE